MAETTSTREDEVKSEAQRYIDSSLSKAYGELTGALEKLGLIARWPQGSNNFQITKKFVEMRRKSPASLPSGLNGIAYAHHEGEGIMVSHIGSKNILEMNWPQTEGRSEEVSIELDEHPRYTHIVREKRDSRGERRSSKYFDYGKGMILDKSLGNYPVPITGEQWKAGEGRFLDDLVNDFRNDASQPRLEPKSQNPVARLFRR